MGPTFTLYRPFHLTSLETPLETQLERELAYIKTCFASSDAAEALAAFAEKRKPQFGGR